MSGAPCLLKVAADHQHVIQGEQPEEKHSHERGQNIRGEEHRIRAQYRSGQKIAAKNKPQHHQRAGEHPLPPHLGVTQDGARQHHTCLNQGLHVAILRAIGSRGKRISSVLPAHGGNFFAATPQPRNRSEKERYPSGPLGAADGPGSARNGTDAHGMGE